MRWPGIEPGSTAWKATMLTITPPSQPHAVVQLSSTNTYRLFPFMTLPHRRSSVTQHKGFYEAWRAYHTDLNSPWQTSLIQCVHYNIQLSCILRLIRPSPRCTAGTRIVEIKWILVCAIVFLFQHKALYTLCSSRLDEKHWRQLYNFK